ncbi:hypothetical protein FHG87_016694 [Trinorchestia longiramus]|nr:hypothetical protein FHG87_016694 [Trinorchestia longiramus]
MNSHYQDPSQLLNTTEISPWTVKCRLVPSQSISVRVIGSFGEDTFNEELTEALKSAGFNGAVAEQIYKVAVAIEEDMGSDYNPVLTNTGVIPSTIGFRETANMEIWKLVMGLLPSCGLMETETDEVRLWG